MSSLRPLYALLFVLGCIVTLWETFLLRPLPWLFAFALVCVLVGSLGLWGDDPRMDVLGSDLHDDEPREP